MPIDAQDVPPAPPPPEPPVAAAVGVPGPFAAPLPPPVAVIVEKTEGEPEVALGPEDGAPGPPPPTVIGKDVAVKVITFAGVQKPSKGLAVKGLTGFFTSLYPPAPPPPPALLVGKLCPAPPPPARTK